MLNEGGVDYPTLPHEHKTAKNCKDGTRRENKITLVGKADFFMKTV